MAADTAELSKVDSAIDSGFSSSPKTDKVAARRKSSTAADVFNIADLEKEGVDIKIAPETQKLNWRLNTAPTSLGEAEILAKPLCTPKLKKIDLHFPLGLEVTARNLKGVTIKDALDAIHKQFKKKADDELENPVLAGFEWDKEECYTRFVVHQKKEGQPMNTSKKSKKKAVEGVEEE